MIDLIQSVAIIALAIAVIINSKSISGLLDVIESFLDRERETLKRVFRKDQNETR